MTRARNWLYVCYPLRYYADKYVLGDQHTLSQLTRFMPADVRARFQMLTLKLPSAVPGGGGDGRVETDARAKSRDFWTRS